MSYLLSRVSFRSKSKNGDGISKATRGIKYYNSLALADNKLVFGRIDEKRVFE